MQIYNETIRDLLTDSDELLDMREARARGGSRRRQRRRLLCVTSCKHQACRFRPFPSLPFPRLLQDPIRGPCVSGVSEHEVASTDDVMALLTAGNVRRTQEPTAANKESSRSHAVLQIVVQGKEPYGADMTIGKLSLIDLAGSERASKTQNRGIRLLEGANINRSLLALGNCITALVQGKGTFVPYRDSKCVLAAVPRCLDAQCRPAVASQLTAAAAAATAASILLPIPMWRAG